MNNKIYATFTIRRDTKAKLKKLAKLYKRSMSDVIDVIVEEKDLSKM